MFNRKLNEVWLKSGTDRLFYNTSVATGRLKISPLIFSRFHWFWTSTVLKYSIRYSSWQSIRFRALPKWIGIWHRPSCGCGNKRAVSTHMPLHDSVPCTTENEWRWKRCEKLYAKIANCNSELCTFHADQIKSYSEYLVRFSIDSYCVLQLTSWRCWSLKQVLAYVRFWAAVDLPQNCCTLEPCAQ